MRCGEIPWRRFCEDDVWRVLSPAETHHLEMSCSTRRNPRQGVLFRQQGEPEGLYCIREGQVLLSQIDRFGNETGFRLATAGEVIGFRSLFAGQPHAATARCVTAATVRFLSRAVIWGLRKDNRALDGAFLRALARDPGFVDAPLLRNPLLPLRVRFAHLLTLLHEDHASEAGDGTLRYDVALTQKDTGAMLGARPETVARLHRELEEAGLCRFGRARITVLDRVAVWRMAGLEYRAE